MSKRGARNNILAGLFVVGALGVGVASSFVLSTGRPLAGLTKFTVRFTLSEGATGLKKGSPVTLAGQAIGRVRQVDFARDAKGQATGVDVAVETRADVALYENAAVSLQLPLLGTLSSINISDIGNPAAMTAFSGASPVIEDNDVVMGHMAPPAFLAQAGIGTEQVTQVRAALAGLEGAVTRASALLDRSGPKVEAGLTDAQQVMAQLRERLTQWSKSIDATAANIEKASARLDPLLTKVDTGVDSATAAINEVRGLIADNREKLTQIVAHVESATGKIDASTIESVNKAIEEGRQALGVFSSALTQLGTVVTQETPSLRHTLANLRIMSDQLKLTSVEVRSQPWRLLHSPTTKEFSAQVLYDATRAYAEAASDLRAASETLAAVGNQAGAQEATEQLTSAVTRYRAAEQALMDKLIEQDKK